MRAAALALLLVATGAAAQSPAVVRALDDGSGEGPAYLFDPTSLTVLPGATVRLQNAGQDAHTLSHDAPERAFHTGAVPAGGTADVTAPAQPGEYPFVCVFHGGMRGTLRVAEALGTTTTTTTPPGGPSPDARGDTPLPLVLALAALAGGALVLRRRA